MTRKADQQRRPRTWDELRRRVLEEDYLEVSELEYRKRKAHQVNYLLGTRWERRWDDLIREKSEQNRI